MNLEGITLRIRNLLLTLVALSLAITASYSFLNWLLVARNRWIPLDEEIADIWLPGMFVRCIVARPRYLSVEQSMSGL